MQGDSHEMNARPLDAGEQLWRKVQAGRRRGDTAPVLREHGLIALPIRLVVGAINVWGERDVPVALDQLPWVAVPCEADEPPAARGGVLDHSPEVLGEINYSAGLELTAGAHERLENGA